MQPKIIGYFLLAIIVFFHRCYYFYISLTSENSCDTIPNFNS